MGQYKEGQRLRGSDGNMYVVRNGVPVSAGASPLIANPKYPYEVQSAAGGAAAAPYQAPQARATLARTGIDVQKNAATLPYDIQSARNAAIKSGIDVKTAQTDLNQKTGTPPGDLNQIGDAYVASLPPGIRDLTKEMLAGNYKGAITTSRNPVVMQAALAAAHATDGKFDAGKYDERLAFVKSITNPNSQLGALNTALAHAGMLHDQAPAVAGTNALGEGPFSMGLNAIDNWWHKGSPAVTNYESTLQKYAPESAKAYGVNTGGERTDMQAPLNINLPLESKQSALANDVKLFRGKIESMMHQYDMTGANNPLDFFSPDARDAIKKLDPESYKRLFGAVPSATNAPPGASPPPGGPQTPPPGLGGPPVVPHADYGAMVGPQTIDTSAAASGATAKSVYDPQTSALVNGYIQQGLSYHEAVSKLSKDVPGASIQATPSQWIKALDWQKKYGTPNSDIAQALKTVPVSLGDQISNAVSQSGPGALAGHYFNAISGNLPGLVAGQDQTALFNSTSRQAHPYLSTTGDVLGTIAGAVGTGKGLKAAAPFLGKFGTAIAGNATRAALSGDTAFFAGSGAAQNPNHPFAGAALGALAGGAGNLLGRFVIGPVVSKGLGSTLGQGIANGALKAKGMFGGSGARFEPPAPLDPGQSLISRQVGGDVADIRNNLQDAASFGLPYALADAHPKLRMLAGSAARLSPDVRTMAENVIGPRQLGQGERSIEQINSLLAPVGDVPTIQSQLLKGAQAKSAPLYAEAKAQPVPELTANPQLKEILDRPAGQSAIRAGYEQALNKGEDVGTLTYATDPNGNPIQYGNPSWNVIHYARQALDATGNTDVRHALDAQISKINPAFKKADAAYSSMLKGSDALQAGADATAIKVTPEATQRALASFPNNAPQFQQGYASNMADMVERQRMAGNPYSMVNGSLGQQAKLATVFPQGAPNFSRVQGLEGDMAKTGYETLGGSPTQGRAQSDNLFENPMMDVAGELGQTMLTGGIPSPKMLGRLILKAGDFKRMGLHGQAKADAVGPILLNPDPNAGLSAIDRLTQMELARKGYLSRVGAASGQFGAGMFGAPILYGASQN